MLNMLIELLKLFQMYPNEKKYTYKVYTGLFIPPISTVCLPWYTHLGHTQGMFIINFYHYFCTVKYSYDCISAFNVYIILTS
jgi:hypothetical protein